MRSTFAACDVCQPLVNFSLRCPRTHLNRLRRDKASASLLAHPPRISCSVSGSSQPVLQLPVESVKSQLQDQLEGTRRGIFGIKVLLSIGLDTMRLLAGS